MSRRLPSKLLLYPLHLVLKTRLSQSANKNIIIIPVGEKITLFNSRRTSY
jgi:hypothetical protein